MWDDVAHMHFSLDRRRTIWVVDDSATDAERVRRLLAEQYDVEVIHDGALALERLSSGTIPDLLLLDWVMPEISGIEVCQYVRSASGKLPQIPIILLTARHGSQEIIQAFKSGANDYVAKPFVDEELKARVESLLEAKRLLERAEQAEADVQSLLSGAPDPIFAIDAQGNVAFANTEALRALELKEDEVLGQPFGALVQGISLSHIGVAPGESLLPLPDIRLKGKIFSPSVRILPSDSAATTTVALRDVTARRQAEARRLDFYSVIAHDLRTPITSVLLRLQLALRGRHGVLPTGLISDLRSIESNLRSQVGMINDFLELARLEGVGYKIDRQPIELGDIVRATIEDFLPLIEKNNLRWKIEGQLDGAIVLGDRQRISQVLANLVGNAIKFTPPPGTITTSIVANADYVEVSVKDTGRGIAKEEIPHLFERFTRARESAGETAGSGLGLMIVRELIEAHGGRFGVESEPGVGSRFWFRLPRHHFSTQLSVNYM